MFFFNSQYMYYELEFLSVERLVFIIAVSMTLIFDTLSPAKYGLVPRKCESSLNLAMKLCTKPSRIVSWSANG